MKKKLRMIAGGVALITAFAGTAYMPSVSWIRGIGTGLLRQTLIFFREPVKDRDLMGELLGGQSYFQCVEENLSYEQICLENQRETEWDKQRFDVLEEQTVETSAAVKQEEVKKQEDVRVEKLKKTKDSGYLLQNFYIVDSTTSVTKKQFQVEKLLGANMKLVKEPGKKQVLIYHTHAASECFADSTKKESDSVIGVGDELTKALEKKGYGVIHDRTKYDLVQGRLDRSLAYNQALASVEKILQKNPSIQVVIDLHRDSVGKGKHTYTTINGKKCAIVMFFNGMSRSKTGPIPYLYNENLTDNLAFSLQLKCLAMERYPGFTKPIYLKGYRYNLHLRKRSLLIELGNENNTVEEAKNAASPLAEVIAGVLAGN